MAPFKVLIVGGSVSGMALANMLEHHGIEYELLEAYPTIAPDMGYVLAMQPDGTRIIHQLGCYDAMKECSIFVQEVYVIGPTGEVLLNGKNHGRDSVETIGYPLISIARRDVIRILYENLKDKSRVHPNQRVKNISSTKSGVTVTTEDGSTWTGDIVVGADGVRSAVRQEMWRIAREDKSDLLGEEDAKSMSSTYSCIFGSSFDVPTISETAFYLSVHEKRTYLISPSQNGMTYWAFFIPSKEVTSGPYGQRYSAEEEQEFVQKYLSDHVVDGVTFGDFYKRKKRSVYITLEEGVMKQWFGPRMVLVGDAAHKIHPIIGAGGGHAIESAAALANVLAEGLQKEPDPSQDSITEMFRRFQNSREEIVRGASAQGHEVQKMQMLDGPIPKFLQLVVIPKLPAGFMISETASRFSAGQRFAALPVPSIPTSWGFDDEIRMRPQQRAGTHTLLFVLGLLLTFLISRLGSVFGESLPKPDLNHSLQQNAQVYSSLYPLVLSVIWTIESYRVGSTMTPLWSSTFWSAMAYIFGYDLVSILYISLYVLVSQKRSFYFPAPRAMSVPTARTFLPVLILTCATPAITTIAPELNLSDSSAFLSNMTYSWRTAQLLYPAMVFATMKLFRLSSERDISALKGNSDIKYLWGTLALVLVLTSSASLLRIITGIAQQEGLSLSLAYHLLAPSNSLTSTIFLWSVFTVWDLARIKAPGIELRGGLLSVIVVSALCGSPAALAYVWMLRERALERGREKMNS
ncbi:hypothetical protein C8Q69DRAFT_178943 [Paecilomyces variotii]|uniref:FAD-binding domain-containing protein n=1 Tax=Byssochlamys spectabilis TaxID=264951 RepID=A0A443I3J9_BYSSP|nr:hypothetical protein C8Q69DRAFT_178943 [Paecilomyces variotii]KAJ9363500.1 hypothetical protein DTO280E4_2482 [Paecilomyces variotii]RWQ98664.1 hypothetical protein C8Q69DRAFT_178943 [Paecilomyces variotii]